MPNILVFSVGLSRNLRVPSRLSPCTDTEDAGVPYNHRQHDGQNNNIETRRTKMVRKSSTHSMSNICFTRETSCPPPTHASLTPFSIVFMTMEAVIVFTPKVDTKTASPTNQRPDLSPPTNRTNKIKNNIIRDNPRELILMPFENAYRHTTHQVHRTIPQPPPPLPRPPCHRRSPSISAPVHSPKCARIWSIILLALSAATPS